MKHYFTALFLAGFLILPLSLPGPAQAQQTPEEYELVEEVQDNPNSQQLKKITAKPLDLNLPIKPEGMSSVFFTFWEHNAIKDARRAIGKARDVTDSELMLDDEPLERIKPPPEEREIALGGIVYRDNDDWTIWLNSQRITPEALPREAVELRVFKDYIEVKWFDDYTRQIYPVRLRSHQRFNLDSRIFLPG